MPSADQTTADQSAFDFLVTAARRLIACETPTASLQTLVDLIYNHWRPDAVSLARVDNDGATTFCAAAGRMADRVVGVSLDAGQGIVGWVAAYGRRLWVPDVHTDDRFCGEVDQLTGFMTQAILAMPLMVGDDVLAVLEFVNPAPETDIRRVDDVVAALALLVAPAIVNVQLVERAHQAETRYQRLFDLNLDPVVVLDQAGRVTEANQSAHKTLGIDPATADSSTLACLGFGERPFSSFREQARQESTVAWEYQLPDGARHFEARVSCLPDYLPGEELYLWIGHDVTDRVGIENARQKFIHMLVHDLRAPLSSVQNSLELVLTAWREKDVTMPVEQVLGIGLRSVSRMGRLISDILDAAALQDQERPLQITEITVSDLINEAVETIATSVSRRDQRLVVEIASDIPVLLGDAELLRRVLINLLTNAVKFTPDQGEIHVTAKPVGCAAPAKTDAADGCEVHFSVTDTGPGIAPEIRENLFKLYVRTSDRRIKGTGIGLAFCKLAVEAHGGRIWFESSGPADEPDKGARFTFAIPCVPPTYVTKDAESLL